MSPDPPTLPPTSEESKEVPTPTGNPMPSPFRVVGVGASAGGLESFTLLLKHLPPNPGIALVLVQHLDPRHESLLASILSQATPMPVTEAKHEFSVEPNHVYVIPPNTQMSIAAGKLLLRPRQGQPSPAMPIDFFFRSMAADLGSKATGIILSGGGADGTLGLEAIKAAGGITFAQDEGSAIQGSMPRSAAASGCVDFVLPIEGIARELLRVGSHPHLSLQDPVENDESKPESGEETVYSDGEMTKLFAVLLARTSVDFTHYKRDTIRRRLGRRIALLGLPNLSALLALIQENTAEAMALFQEFLLRVTSFFRDPEAFETLRTNVFPVVMKDLDPEGAIRIWVPGCSTGEEAYSIAIALTEFLGDMASNMTVKILATDVNELVLEKARAGIYLESIAQDVSPERLRRFFQKVGNQYRISKSIRDICVFARHNVFRDPPFARMDLISCRNLLIYFDAALQRRVLPLFHYALRQNRFLLLGPSETVGALTELFSLVEREQSLYLRTLGPSRMLLDVQPREVGLRASANTGSIASNSDPSDLTDVQREVDRLLSRYAPPGVLIDENLNILQFRGDTSPYLRNPPGTPSLDILRMAPDGLLADLRESIHSARSTNAAFRKELVRLDPNSVLEALVIQVIPVKVGISRPRCFLVLFESQNPTGMGRGTPALQANRTLHPEEVDERLVLLRRELEAAREHLQSVTEEHESTNEELKSANEEILASNEELQSTNEELQTAKEEMQSANEELETTNQELNTRNREMGLVNDDLTNLLAAAYIPVVMVNRDLRIRRFTAQAEKLFNLMPGDVGRPIREIRSELNCPDLDRIIARVIDTLEACTLEVSETSGHWHSLRVRPYETNDNRIDGAVITVIDIDAIKRSEQQIRESRDFANRILDAVQESLLVLDKESRVQTANRTFFRTFQFSMEDIHQKSIFELGSGEWNTPGLQHLLEEARKHGTHLDYEWEHDFPDLGHRVFRLNLRPLSPQDLGGLLLLVAEDITERRRLEVARREMDSKMYHSQKLESLGILAGGVAHDLNNLLTPVMGYVELAIDSLPSDSQTQELLREAASATRKAADLVTQILAYSGKGRFIVQPVDLGALIREMQGLLGAAVNKTAELRFELAEIPIVVEADATQMTQVLMNLVTNASESLNKAGGTIVVRTRTVQADAELLRSPFLKEELPPGSYAVIEVEDTGSGMSRSIVEKIFDPFFTTKFMGRGLGLAAVLGIVRGHRGALQVQTELGKGSTFQILLPCANQPLPRPTTQGDFAADWRGTGTILVVDDEPRVRAVATLFLEHMGFTVLSASDGVEALEMLRLHQAAIRMVLLDLTMPKMGGLECSRGIHLILPNLPVILMSGYSLEEVSLTYTNEKIAGFVQKPFGMSALGAIVRKALQT